MSHKSFPRFSWGLRRPWQQSGCLALLDKYCREIQMKDWSNSEHYKSETIFSSLLMCELQVASLVLEKKKRRKRKSFHHNWFRWYQEQITTLIQFSEKRKISFKRAKWWLSEQCSSSFWPVLQIHHLGRKNETKLPSQEGGRKKASYSYH